MKKTRKTQNENSSERYDDTYLQNEKPSRLSGSIFLLLCVILIFSTLAYGGVETWALALLSIFAGLIAILWLADSFFNREFRFSSNAIQLPLLGLILIGFIQLLPVRSLNIANDLLSQQPINSLSLDPYSTRLFLIRLCIYLIFFAACLTFINSPKRLRMMVFTIIIFGSMMAFFGIIQRLTGTDTIYGIRKAPSNPFGSFVNQHHFAAFMYMIIGLTLSLLYGNATKRDKRLLLIISLILTGTAQVLTSSRGAMVSLLGVLGFVTILNLFDRKNIRDSKTEDRKTSNFRRKILLVGSGLMLILVLIGSALLLGGESSATHAVGLANPEDISSGRVYFWQTTLHIIRDNPIIGAGLEAFSVAYTRYDPWNGNITVNYAHNEYLQILADAGILGFICLIAFIYFLFKRGLGVVKESEDPFRRGVAVGALAGCFGILIHSFFDFPLRTSSNAFFFLTLVSLAIVPISYSKLHRKKNKKAV